MAAISNQDMQKVLQLSKNLGHKNLEETITYARGKFSR
jgi:hypothetical protein